LFRSEALILDVRDRAGCPKEKGARKRYRTGRKG
jgi:hypothetical protein